MLKLKIFGVTTLLALILFPAVALAKDHGFIMSIVHSIHQDQLYQVQVSRIDEKNPMPAREYYVEAGEHTIRLSLVLDPQWAPDLEIAAGGIYYQDLKINIENGVTYELAGKVNPKASDEEQRAGTFWEPVIHRQLK